MHNIPHTKEAKKKISDAHKGKHHSPSTEFKKGSKGYWLGKKRPGVGGNPKWKKGFKPWNYGTRRKRICLMCDKELGHGKNVLCKKHSVGEKGERHHAWKGDNVSNSSLHQWVQSKLGKPRLCSSCGSSEEKAYDWANKDHTYKRNLNDWIRLCRKCHIRYDRENNNYISGRKKKIYE